MTNAYEVIPVATQISVTPAGADSSVKGGFLKRLGFFVLSLVALTLAACNTQGSSSQNAVPNTSYPIHGTYVGTLDDNIGGAGNLTLVLAQSGSSISGTFSSSFTARTSSNDTGSVSGLVQGTLFTGDWVPNNPNGCEDTFSATVTSATVISGNYTTFNCSTGDGGTFSVSIQSAASS